jgi:hypothetical protein
MCERKVQTVRQAVAVALEGPGGELLEWVVLAKQKDAMRKHVKGFVHDFARNRGVILSDRDITDELDRIVAELKGGKPLTGEVQP